MIYIIFSLLIISLSVGVGFLLGKKTTLNKIIDGAINAKLQDKSAQYEIETSNKKIKISVDSVEVVK